MKGAGHDTTDDDCGAGSSVALRMHRTGVAQYHDVTRGGLGGAIDSVVEWYSKRQV